MFINFALTAKSPDIRLRLNCKISVDCGNIPQVFGDELPVSFRKKYINIQIPPHHDYHVSLKIWPHNLSQRLSSSPFRKFVKIEKSCHHSLYFYKLQPFTILTPQNAQWGEKDLYRVNDCKILLHSDSSLKKSQNEMLKDVVRRTTAVRNISTLRQFFVTQQWVWEIKTGQ